MKNNLLRKVMTSGSCLVEGSVNGPWEEASSPLWEALYLERAWGPLRSWGLGTGLGSFSFHPSLCTGSWAVSRLPLGQPRGSFLWLRGPFQNPPPLTLKPTGFVPPSFHLFFSLPGVSPSALNMPPISPQSKEWLTLFSWAPKSLQMVTSAMKLKDAYCLKGKLWPT